MHMLSVEPTIVRPDDFASAPVDWTSSIGLTGQHLQDDAQWLDQFGQFVAVTHVEAPKQFEPSECGEVIWGGQFYSNVTNAYRRFLYLSAVSFAAGREGPLHPSYAVDLAWHAHMASPREYSADCRALTGGAAIFDHDPWPEVHDDDVADTNALWLREFGTNIDEEHVWDLKRC
jgi:hypothetical protein